MYLLFDCVYRFTLKSSCTENDGNCSGSVGGGSCGSGSSGNSRTHQRRSSFVVIPPMQICPGDLLVYSKVLTQRNSVLGKSFLQSYILSDVLFLSLKFISFLSLQIGTDRLRASPEIRVTIRAA